MRVLPGARCTDAKLYTLRVKLVPEQREQSKVRIVELASVFINKCTKGTSDTSTVA